MKDASPKEISDAVRTVYKGGTMLQSDIAVKIIDKFSQLANESKRKITDKRVEELTEREIEILRLIAEGKNNKEIGDELFISQGTVKNHITRILLKLDLRDRTQLAVFAIKNDI